MSDLDPETNQNFINDILAATNYLDAQDIVTKLYSTGWIYGYENNICEHCLKEKQKRSR